MWQSVRVTLYRKLGDTVQLLANAQYLNLFRSF